MKKLVIIALVFVVSCKSYVQLFDTQATNLKLEDKTFVFENDSIKINYYFWANKGQMTFGILNKLDKPLYIDWKKSSYIDNSIKLDYWIDEEKKKSLQYYGSYYYDGANYNPELATSKTVGIGAATSSTVKVERITFIPPKSKYYRSQFHILPISYYKMDVKAKYDIIPSTIKPEEKVKVYKQFFDKETSPMVFRNFLTFSYTEDFKNEFYVDNEFFVNQVREMDASHFYYYKRDENKKSNYYIRDKKGNPIKFSKYKKSNSFYLFIPRSGSIEKRK